MADFAIIRHQETDGPRYVVGRDTGSLFVIPPGTEGMSVGMVVLGKGTLRGQEGQAITLSRHDDIVPVGSRITIIA